MKFGPKPYFGLKDAGVRIVRIIAVEKLGGPNGTRPQLGGDAFPHLELHASLLPRKRQAVRHSAGTP